MKRGQTNTYENAMYVLLFESVVVLVQRWSQHGRRIAVPILTDQKLYT
jgi:hypothetical protein